MKSYLKFLSRNKLYTAIEAAGLIVSLAFVVIISCYVWQQFAVTREAPDYKRTVIVTLGREELQAIHRQIEQDDQVKTTFLHNVTNRMIPHSEAIIRSVTKLSDHYQDISLADADKEIDHIKQQSETILELLSHKFNPVSHE